MTIAGQRLGAESTTTAGPCAPEEGEMAGGEVGLGSNRGERNGDHREHARSASNGENVCGRAGTAGQARSSGMPLSACLGRTLPC